MTKISLEPFLREEAVTSAIMRERLRIVEARADSLLAQRDAALAEVERLRADRDAGARDYCALMDRYDTHVNEVARLREALPVTFDIYRLIKRSGAKKRVDVAKVVADYLAAIGDTGGKG